MALDTSRHFSFCHPSRLTRLHLHGQDDPTCPPPSTPSPPKITCFRTLHHSLTSCHRDPSRLRNLALPSILANTLCIRHSTVARPYSSHLLVQWHQSRRRPQLPFIQPSDRVARCFRRAIVPLCCTSAALQSALMPHLTQLALSSFDTS